MRVVLSQWEEKWHFMECLQAWSLWWTCHCLLIWCRQEVSVQFIWWQVAPCINESTTCNHINLTNTHLKELHCNIDTQFVIYFLYRTMTGVKCVQVYYVLCSFCTICELNVNISSIQLYWKKMLMLKSDSISVFKKYHRKKWYAGSRTRTWARIEHEIHSVML